MAIAVGVVAGGGTAALSGTGAVALSGADAPVGVNDDVHVRTNDVAVSLALVATATPVVSAEGVSVVSGSLEVQVKVVPVGNVAPAGAVTTSWNVPVFPSVMPRIVGVGVDMGSPWDDADAIWVIAKEVGSD